MKDGLGWQALELLVIIVGAENWNDFQNKDVKYGNSKSTNILGRLLVYRFGGRHEAVWLARQILFHSNMEKREEQIRTDLNIISTETIQVLGGCLRRFPIDRVQPDSLDLDKKFPRQSVGYFACIVNLVRLFNSGEKELCLGFGNTRYSKGSYLEPCFHDHLDRTSNFWAVLNWPRA